MLTAPVTTISTSASTIPGYAAVEVALAQSTAGVDVANVLDRWGSTYNAAYSDGSSDTVHPGDTGTLSEAAMLLEHLVDFAPYTAGGGSASNNSSGGNSVTGSNAAFTATATSGSQYSGFVLDSSALTPYQGQK